KAIMIGTHYLISIPIGTLVLLFQSRKMPVQHLIKVFPVTFTQCHSHPHIHNPFNPASRQQFRIPAIFSSVSLIKGRIGISQTTVGIPASLIIFSTLTRSLVTQTFGSMILHRLSSYVVSVIWTTAFVFSLILRSSSRSRRILSDFVSTVTPNPYCSISSRHFLVIPSCSSQCI